MTLDDIVSNLASLTTDALGIVHRTGPDAEPRLVWANEGFCRLVRRPADEVLGNNPNEMLHHPDHVRGLRASLDAAVAAGRNRLAIESRCLRGDGTDFWASLLVTIFPAEDGSRTSITSVRDVDDLKRREQAAERALAEREKLLVEIEAVRTRLVSAINAIPFPLAIWDPDFRLVVANAEFAPRVLGRPGAMASGCGVDEVLWEAAQSGQFVDALGREEDWWRQSVAEIRSGPINLQAEYTDGRVFRALSTATPNGDTVIVSLDITELLENQRSLESYARKLEEANREIGHQALHDDLTGLGNRRHLATKLKEFTEDRRRNGGEIAVLHVDLDRFKQINDQMGHAAGDQVLKAVASRMRARIRANDVVARTGGDEFIVLVRCQAGSSDPDGLATRIVEDLARPVVIDGTPCHCGASIGLASTPLVEPAELLTSSDVALYRAKDAGRSRVVRFDVADIDRVRQSKRLSDEILRAVEAGDFVPLYQPQVDAATGEVVAYEVLARWQHPERGLLSPSEFLATAAQMRLDGQIDRMIFRRALADFGGNPGATGTVPALAFNVSLPRIMNAAMLADIRDLGYPGRITLELLETVFLEEDSNEFLHRIDLLREAGIGLEVDDFGSGRASIVALRRLAPDRLKIDRRLTPPIADSEGDRRLMQSIVGIGRALGIGVTAVGVETADQARILKGLGCDRLQGFRFGAPARFADLPENVAGRAPQRVSGPGQA